MHRLISYFHDPHTKNHLHIMYTVDMHYIRVYVNFILRTNVQFQVHSNARFETSFYGLFLNLRRKSNLLTFPIVIAQSGENRAFRILLSFFSMQRVSTTKLIDTSYSCVKFTLIFTVNCGQKRRAKPHEFSTIFG